MKKQAHEDSVTSPQVVTFDAIMPAAMAVRAEASGVMRASTDPITLLALSVLAGAFISFGAIFATTVSAGAVGMPYGIVLFDRPHHGCHWRGGTVHGKQYHCHGLGERQGDDARASTQLGSFFRR
jgi:hypothetical protein